LVGVRSHVTKWFGASAVNVTRHVVWAAITNCSLTVITAPAQVRVTDAGALVATSQVPGPWRGTSATLKVELSCPPTTPLEPFAADAFTFDLAFESVTLEELVTRTAFVERTVAVGSLGGTFRLSVAWAGARTVARATGDVVLVTGIVVGAVSEAPVGRVVGGAPDRASRWCAGVELDEAVQVKTRTKRRTGLDHITQCVLVSECGSLISVL
jgi:hypothetical protein